MKKKVKDLTLEEVTIICEKSCMCCNCPLHDLGVKTTNGNTYRFCPYETRISEIGELKDHEIEVNLYEEEDKRFDFRRSNYDL